MICPLCGAADAACGHPYTGKPFDLEDGEGKAMEAATVRVDDGHGNTFQFNDADARSFIGAHPGARLLSETVAVAPLDAPATEASALASLTRAALEEKAASMGVDVSGAKNKGEIVELLEGAATITDDDEN